MSSSDKNRVTAQIHPANRQVCLFRFGTPLFPGGSFNCAKAESARGSPLLEALFSLDGVAQVWVAEDRVTVEKNSEEPWTELGKRVVHSVRRLLKEEAGPLVVPPVPKKDDSVLGRVETILENEINPAIAAHGGRVDAVDYKDGVLSLTMSGGCQGCTAAAATLRGGVESAILSRVPEIAEIVDVTDHAAGERPYYGEEPGETPL